MKRRRQETEDVKDANGEEDAQDEEEDYAVARHLSGMLTGDENDPRAVYEYIIMSPNAKERLFEIASKAVSMMGRVEEGAGSAGSAGGGSAEEGSVSAGVGPVIWDGRREVKIQGVASIGRRTWCDVIFQELSVSRLHVVIIPTGDGYMHLVDVGSLSGVNYYFIGENDSVVHQSIRSCGARSVRLRTDATVLLEIGAKQLVLNPKKCIACEDRPRSTMFACGHYCLCHPCSMRVAICPLCRTDVEYVGSATLMRLQTNCVAPKM